MIGIIGCGNMANAIVRGFYSKDSSQKFLTYNPTKTAATTLANAVQGQACESLSDLRLVDSVLVACKPQQLNQLVEDLKAQGLSLNGKHIISILAAVPLAVLQAKLDCQTISRVMPNTPAVLGQGVSLIMHSEAVSDQQRDLTNRFFKSCGETISINDEILFDQVTTVTGSGPAYVFLFAQGMVEKLKAWGMDENQARLSVTQLFQGSAALMRSQSDLSLQELIDQVTSKGGVTIEAVKSYRQEGLEEITGRALSQAYRRSQEMSLF